MFVPDTTEESSSLALAQATSYAIMDYFNQYVFAETSANMIGEITYTETMTFWSTLISAPLVYFGSWAVSAGVGKMFSGAGATAVKKSIERSVVQGLKGMVLSPIQEVFQEIIEDGFIEALAENFADGLGWTEDAGFWLSSFATSVRETKGALGQLARGDTGIKTTISLIKARMSGDTKTAAEIKAKIEQGIKQQQEDAIAKQQQVSSWKKLVNSGFFKGLLMVLPVVLYGSFSFAALKGLNSMIKGTINIVPQAYSRFQSEVHAYKKGRLQKMVGTQDALINNMQELMKKPADLEAAKPAINEKYKASQETQKENPPLAAFLSSLNYNPKTESKKSLTNKFKTIWFENYFNEWIEVNLLQDDRFEHFKEDFKKVQKNYKQIGIQKAEKEIINQIHEILKDHPQRLRWVNMFGVVMYDPLLCFAGFPRAAVELLRNYDIASNKKSKEKIIEDIQRITGIAVDLELIHISGEHIPDGTKYIVQWLEDRDFTVDDKIIVVPKILLKEGSGLFDRSNWDSSKTSPYHPFFLQFLTELFNSFKEDKLISSDKADPSIRHLSEKLAPLADHNDQYFKNLLSSMKSGSGNTIFLPTGINLDKWYFSFKQKIIQKFALSPQKSSNKKTLDRFIGLSQEGQQALSNLDKIFLKYNLMFGQVYNSYALEMRNTFVCMLDFFRLEKISDLSTIIDYSKPDQYYKLQHPKKTPKDLNSMLSRLVIGPLKFMINEKTGQSIDDANVVINQDERKISIGNLLLIDYSTEISIEFSKTVSDDLKQYIQDYLGTVEGTINNILSYWKIYAQLSVYQDSFKKSFFLQIFDVMNRRIPLFEDINIDQISILLYPDRRATYLAETLGSSASKRTTDIFKIEKLKFTILHLSRNDLNRIFKRKLTRVEFEYMKADILDKIDKFILDFQVEIAPNSKTFKYAFYSNIPYRDRLKIHNFVTNILIAAKLESQRDLKLYELKNIFSIGDAIMNLRRRGYPTINEHSLIIDFKNIYHTIYSWFERDFGTRDPALIKYTQLSRADYNKFFYYTQALQSIVDICRDRGYDFASPSITGFSLIQAINSERELVMNYYDLKYWEDKPIGDTVKAFHRVYHLTKYLGFDPLFFASLDSNMGKSRRHHFLGFIFRKMSSFVGDQVLTNVKFHPSYEALFESMGERQAQAFIEGLLESLEELIWLTDNNGNFKKIEEADIKAVFKKHLGSLSEKAFNYWTRGIGENSRTITEFRESLKDFNKKREYIMYPNGKPISDGHQTFLYKEFSLFYNDDFLKVIKLNPELFLGSKKDFGFLNTVYIGIHRFDLSKL